MAEFKFDDLWSKFEALIKRANVQADPKGFCRIDFKVKGQCYALVYSVGFHGGTKEMLLPFVFVKNDGPGKEQPLFDGGMTASMSQDATEITRSFRVMPYWSDESRDRFHGDFNPAACEIL